MFLRGILFFLALAAMQWVAGQAHIGQREIINYRKGQYNAGTQNWKIRQDEQGRMYFANNEGLLVFDGINWQLYPLPNKTIVRSLEFGTDKKIYVGGQDELGYFSSGKAGALVFTSIKALIPAADKNFSDIWDIVNFQNSVFYRSHFKIFRYSAGKITVYHSNSSWLFFGNHLGNLIAQDEKSGLLILKNGKWQTFIEQNRLPKDFYITSIIKYSKDTSLVTTSKNGVFLLYGNQLKPWPLTGIKVDNNQVFSSALALDKSNFLIGTYSNGIYLVDRSGNVVENISQKEGLQNGNVRSNFVDSNHNLWLGLDNGIDYIAYNNAVKHINPPIFKDGGGYAVNEFEGNLYFSLSNGIYRLPVSNSGDLSSSAENISTVTQGQSWHLGVIDNCLLAGNDNGVFQIRNNQPVTIDPSYGFWIFRSLADKSGTKLIAAGNYYGVELFEYKNGTFISKGNLGNYKESARFLEIDKDNSIWTSHPYRGVYKLTLGTSDNVKLYTKAQGLPSTLNNFVFKIKGTVVVATEKGVFEYNKKADKFEMSKRFAADFGNRNLRYLKEDPFGNIWFVEGKNVGVVDYSTSRHEIIYFPELNNRILSGFENIYTKNDSNVFVGGENGFYHINFAKYKANIQPIKVYIRKVKAISTTDSLLFGGYIDNSSDQKNAKKSTLALSFLWNSLHFEFSSPVFEAQSTVEYSYLLEGYDKGWSEWSKKAEKDYTNLSWGKYIFKVKARNLQNNTSSISSYAFYINPPWYQTIWAYTFYLLIFAGSLYYFYKLQEKRHIRNHEKELLLQRQKNEEEQRQMAYLHQLELEISEKEVIKLKNEKLETEIEYKNSELASAAMNIVQKKEFLIKVKEELQTLIKSGKESIQTFEIKRIARLLTEDKKINEEWEQFSIHFNKVHGDFLNKIKERYPAINQQELKLSAYLIMNLSSKEIAQLMCISVRGVEISRYRLRKKLHIPTETNLFEFLFEIQREGISQ